MSRHDPDAPGEPDATESDISTEIRAEALLLERAIGGWRGIIDSGLPIAVFVVAYVVTSSALRPSLIAAVLAGAVIVVWRVMRREPLWHIVAGFVGLGISALWAARTDNASNVYIWGMLLNAGYGAAFLVSILLRWPLLGVAMGVLTGDGTAWRKDRALRRRYTAASWIWVGVFGVRLAVQIPLYLSQAVVVQGVVKIVMGFPLFLGGAYVTYLVLRPVFVARREANRAEGAGSAESSATAD